jgi:hypothetical protein
MPKMFRQPTKMDEHKSPKKTRQSRTKNIATSTMNKSQKRMRGKSRYRGQGR